MSKSTANRPLPAAPCSAFVADVLAHTSRTGRYVTRDPEVIKMALIGLLHDHGPQRLAGGDHYFTLTEAGRQMLAAWRESQPKPKPPTRAQLRWQEFRSFRDAYPGMSFREWLKIRV